MRIDEAIKFAEHAQTMADIPEVKEFYAMAEKALRIQNQVNWISVKDRLPEEHDSIFAKFHGTKKWRTGMFCTVSDDVIACIEYGKGHRMVKVLSTQDGKWGISSIHQAEVTHWMPLPEPPEREGE